MLMTYYLTTSPFAGRCSGIADDTMGNANPSAFGRVPYYIGGMISFALSLPIRVAILAFRVVKALVAILYAIFGTLSQDRAKNWKQCRDELVRVAGSLAEILSGCLGVIAPPFAYRLELKLYTNKTIREGAIWTVRKEVGGVKFQPSGITPTPEKTPVTLPSGSKPYVRSTNRPSAPPSGALDVKQLEAKAQQIGHLMGQMLDKNQDPEKLIQQLLAYITERIAAKIQNREHVRILKEIKERILSQPTTIQGIAAVVTDLAGQGPQIAEELRRILAQWGLNVELPGQGPPVVIEEIPNPDLDPNLD